MMRPRAPAAGTAAAASGVPPKLLAGAAQPGEGSSTPTTALLLALCSLVTIPCSLTDTALRCVWENSPPLRLAARRLRAEGGTPPWETWGQHFEAHTCSWAIEQRRAWEHRQRPETCYQRNERGTCSSSPAIADECPNRCLTRTRPSGCCTNYPHFAAVPGPPTLFHAAESHSGSSCSTSDETSVCFGKTSNCPAHS